MMGSDLRQEWKWNNWIHFKALTSFSSITPFRKLQPVHIWSRVGWEGTLMVCQELGLPTQPICHAE